jgi:oxygen-independent coproporphyrinogen-3 oxidase
MSTSLYVHIPWCARKCPYCDFNSHEIKGDIPKNRYIEALLDDLEAEIRVYPIDAITSIFIGGGTPSVFEPHLIEQLLTGIESQIALAPGAEITMEANPGTIDNRHIAGYRRAGVNRLSLGVQSFDDRSLEALGRIHASAEALDAFRWAREAGFDNINVDLMHGLPGQDWEAARQDLATAIDLAPDHISWYQLTIEPNTAFYSNPPRLPGEDELWEIYQSGMLFLDENGYARYEISAFSRPGRQSVHNLNYWHFGDYLGIGAGAHGKVTDGEDVIRTSKSRVPKDYLARQRSRRTLVEPKELPLEFLMNALRLCEGFTLSLFEERTGLPRSVMEKFLTKAAEQNLIDVANEHVKPTLKGLQFLDELLLIIEDRIA